MQLETVYDWRRKSYVSCIELSMSGFTSEGQKDCVIVRYAQINPHFCVFGKQRWVLFANDENNYPECYQRKMQKDLWWYRGASVTTAGRAASVDTTDWGTERCLLGSISYRQHDRRLNQVKMNKISNWKTTTLSSKKNFQTPIKRNTTVNMSQSQLLCLVCCTCQIQILVHLQKTIK